MLTQPNFKKPLQIVCVVLLISITGNTSFSQGLLKKLKKQTEQKILKKTDEAIDDVIFGEDNDSNSNTGNKPSGTNSNSSSPSNTTGSGLVVEPPDVLKNINEAEQAFDVKNYGTARYAVRQAMLGIEMEIGENILKSLPTSVDGLNADLDQDEVTSMSYGFVGLMMERVYTGGNKQLKVNIGNNSALLSATNMMLSSGAYSTSSSDESYKQTTFKGYRSVLQYDNSSGYTLSVPFGQSSVFVLNGINYESEAGIMAAAENFDIEVIKQELGEK